MVDTVVDQRLNLHMDWTYEVSAPVVGYLRTYEEISISPDSLGCCGQVDRLHLDSVLLWLSKRPLHWTHSPGQNKT